MIFTQGDIVKVDFNPVAGHEQGDYRPALVLNNIPLFGNMSLVVPITSRPMPMSGSVKLPKGMKTEGYALCFQLRSTDLNKRGAVVIEKAPEQLVRDCSEVAAELISVD